MASVFRKWVTRPLPAGAELYTRKGEQFARWKDSRGKNRTAPVTTGRDGTQRVVLQSGTYTAKSRNASGVVREVSTGCRSKSAAQAVLRDLTDQAEKVKAGVLTAEELEIGFQQSTGVAEHVGAYLNHLKVSGCSARYMSETKRLVERVCGDCRFNMLGDIRADAMERWLIARESAGMGARTRNSYLQAIRGFCEWCVEEANPPRMAKNPLAKVERAKEREDVRRKRRAMNEEELAKLLYVARWRPLAEYGRVSVRKDQQDVKRKRDTWKALPLTLDEIGPAVERARDRLSSNPAFVAELEARGRQRALVYKALVLTGLRRGELASLTVGQLELDGPVPCIVLEAADEKNREGSTLPLRSDLAADLRHWVQEKREASVQQSGAVVGSVVGGGGSGGVRLPMPSGSTLPRDTPLFSVPQQLVKAMNRDLAAAGIPKVDERGRTLDVHALRHSFGTLMSKGGVAPRTAQAAMRHSRIDLTMNLYTDPKLLDVAGAVEALPTLPLPEETQHRERDAQRAAGA